MPDTAQRGFSEARCLAESSSGLGENIDAKIVPSDCSKEKKTGEVEHFSH